MNLRKSPVEILGQPGSRVKVAAGYHNLRGFCYTPWAQREDGHDDVGNQRRQREGSNECEGDFSPIIHARLRVHSYNMRSIIALGVLAFVLNYANAQSRLQTFSTQNGAITFRHSSLLVHCTKEPRQRVWFPDESCTAYSSVCDDPSDLSSTTIACFAYPKHGYEHSNLEAAAFSVADVRSAENVDECLSGPEGSRSVGTESINGQRFKVFTTSDAGLGHGLEAHVYRIFHNDECYSLVIRMAWSNPGNYDPGAIKVLTGDEQQDIYDRLKQVLQSVKFRK